MDKAPVFQAEISHRYISENKGSAELTLPATCFEIQDALERAGLEAGDEAFCEIIGYPRFPFLEDCLEFTLDPYALNALAEKLDSLTDRQRDAFEGLVIMAIQRSGSVTLGELYDLAASADECQVLYDAHSDAELGLFYVDNGFVPEAEDIPEALYRLLDFEKIGKEYREGEGGVFLRHGSGYVVQTGELREEFKDLDLTPREPDYAVLMEVGLPDTDDRVLLKLPCAPHDLDAALESLGVQDGCFLSWRCADCRIPALRDAFSLGDGMNRINEAAELLARLSPSDLQKMKGLTEALSVDDLPTAARLMRTLDEYRLLPQCRTPLELVRLALEERMDSGEAAQLLPHVNCRTYADELIRQGSLFFTPFGLVAGIAEETPLQDQRPTGPGDMQLM